MKKYILILCSVILVCCKSETINNTENLADLNLYFQTEEDIDSVWITDFGMTRENHKVAFNDTISISLNDSINDLYRIEFLKNGKIISSPMSNQIWLQGEKIIINGYVEKKLVIDTIINSDVDYKVKKFRKDFKELFNNKADSNTIDKFILKSIKENYNSPSSLQIADLYVFRNKNNKSKLKELQSFIKNQNTLIKNHQFFNFHNELAKKLEVEEINASVGYSVLNIENKIERITFKENKMFLIDLWFVNCPPCVKDHKIISKNLDFLKKKNIELIGISIDKDYSKWKTYLETHNYDWKNFREIDSLKTITKDLGISGFPTYVLLKDTGKIETIFNSYKQIEDYLKDI